MSTINIDTPFLRGTVTANKVLKAHRDLAFPDDRSRIAAFWFYVGAVAAGEYNYSKQDDLSMFLLGAAVTAPQPPDVEVTFNTDNPMFEEEEDGDLNIPSILRRIARDITDGVRSDAITAVDGAVIGRFDVRS